MAPGHVDSDDDDDDETDALLAEIGADASSLNNWCQAVRTEATTVDDGGGPCEPESARPPPAELEAPPRSSFLLSSRGCVRDDEFAHSHRGNDHTNRADGSSSVLATKAEVRSHEQSSILGPLHLMAYGVGFVVLMTVLAILTTSTATRPGPKVELAAGLQLPPDGLPFMGPGGMPETVGESSSNVQPAVNARPSGNMRRRSKGHGLGVG
mmetsp:Transcript_107647/g.213912  ORF Transcript_107647/g.213912 Transcript_107647/m.213912 type:complete len:210 (+) Transcript_107647:74-703(+)